MDQNSIEIRNLSKTFIRPDGNVIEICRNFNLNIEEGKIYAIIGNSGSGKTTLINMIAGFEKYDSGNIILDGGNKEYKVGILFQNNVLYPWKTIMENMLFVCKKDYENPKKVVREYLKRVGLENTERCYPNELSGGMQQRIALLRILLINPNLVILDEAFGALDFQTRNQMQEFFLELHNRQKFTSLIVTHDLAEAVRMGDKIVEVYGKPLRYKIFNNEGTTKKEKVRLLKQLETIFINKEKVNHDERILQY